MPITVIADETSVVGRVPSFSSLTIWPNPANDIITLSGLDGTAILQVYDINGKLIMGCNVNENDEIDMRSVNAGLYFLRATTSSGMYS